MRSLFEFTTIGDDIPRLDPTDGFEEYKDGFDPDEEAYAYSLGFLALPGVVLCALSILIPIVFFMVRCLCCSWRKKAGCWPTATKQRSMACPMISIIFFALPILCGSILVYYYGAEATSSVNDFTDVLVKNTLDLVTEITEISDALVAASLKLGTMGDTVNVVTDLTSDAVRISKEVKDFEDLLTNAFDIAELAFLIAACVFLFFGLLCLISTICKWRSVVIVLTIIMPLISVISWASMAVTFPMTSLFADVCNESLEYLADPTNSTITKYIPCPDKQTSKETLNDAYKSLNDFGVEVNKQVANVNTETASALAACSGISSTVCDDVRSQAVTLKEMCLPFTDCRVSPGADVCQNEDRLTDYAPSQCPHPTAENTVTLAGFRAYYKPYACLTNEKVTCRNSGKPITKDEFEQMAGYADGASDLLKVLPATEDLIKCQFVTETLEDLTTQTCKPCVDNLDNLWIGFALVGIGMFVIWFLLIKAQARMVKGGYVDGGVTPGQPFQVELGSKP